MKRPYVSQIVRAEENTMGPTGDNLTPTNGLKLNVRTNIESEALPPPCNLREYPNYKTCLGLQQGMQTVT